MYLCMYGGCTCAISASKLSSLDCNSTLSFLERASNAVTRCFRRSSREPLSPVISSRVNTRRMA